MVQGSKDIRFERKKKKKKKDVLTTHTLILIKIRNMDSDRGVLSSSIYSKLPGDFVTVQ